MLILYILVRPVFKRLSACDFCMKIALFPLSQGAMGKNTGTEAAPAMLAKSLGLQARIAEIDASDLEKTHSNIEQTAAACLNEKALFLGGDHSIAYSTIKAFSKKVGKKNARLLMFDAHVDCNFFISIKTHEDFIRALVEEGFLQPKNILLVGIRHIWKEERAFLKKKKISYITTVQLKKNPKKARKAITDFVSASKELYVSIDFDGLDARIAFATGYPEPRGLSEKQLLELLGIALDSKKVRACDFVEFNPLLDRKDKGLALAKRILEFVLQCF